MSALDGLADEPNPDLCMCRVEEYDGGPPGDGPLIVWRPCPLDLCERIDHDHRRYECVCARCTERVYPGDYTYPECVRCYVGCGH